MRMAERAVNLVDAAASLAALLAACDFTPREARRLLRDPLAFPARARRDFVRTVDDLVFELPTAFAAACRFPLFVGPDCRRASTGCAVQSPTAIAIRRKKLRV
jgi:hypothetical protein